MGSILQGTTPIFKCRIPQEVPVNTIDALELTIRNAGTLSIYHLDDVVIDSEDNTINRLFTEDETLALDADKPIHWQLRLRTPDGIYGTPKTRIDVLDLMSKEKIR